MRRVRILLAALAIALIIGPNPLAERRGARFDARGIITARALALPPPTGRLVPVEAWELTSPHSRFGGYSALVVFPGRRFLLAGDNGWTARFRLDPAGRTHDVRIAPLPDGPGDPRAPRVKRDLEALVALPGGDLVAAFEHGHALWRYDAGLTRARRHARPAAMRDWPANQGAEAMARLSPRRWLVLPEYGSRAPGAPRGILFAGDPSRDPRVIDRVDYDAAGRGAVTDMARLAGGRIVILHRRVSLWHGWTGTLAIADPPSPGATRWRAVTLGRIAPSLAENYEGLAVTRDRQGELLWLVSDNNQTGWQATRLVAYRLTAPKPASAARRP